MRSLLAVALSSLAVTSAGCAMDFRPQSLVLRERIVGIEVTIEGAGRRAQPLPGETFVATPVRVSADGATPISTAWLACPQLPTRTGVPECAGTPLAFGAPVLGAAPPMTVTVPPDALARGVFAVLFVIASCDGGALPRLPEEGSESVLPTCEGGSEDARAELSVFSITLALDPASANLHPVLTDETTSLLGPDGTMRDWTAAPAPVGPTGCALLADDPSLPHLVVPPLPAMGGERDEDEATWTFGITSSADDRQLYQRVVPGGEPPMDTREVLQLSHYVTAGTLQRQFSAVEGMADVAEPSTIEWLLPEPADVPDDGLLVRVWWVGRDLRGGTAITERALCVTR